MCVCVCSFHQLLLKSAKKMASQEGAMENTLNVSPFFCVTVHRATCIDHSSLESPPCGETVGQIFRTVSIVLKYPVEMYASSLTFCRANSVGRR